MGKPRCGNGGPGQRRLWAEAAYKHLVLY